MVILLFDLLPGNWTRWIPGHVNCREALDAGMRWMSLVPAWIALTRSHEWPAYDPRTTAICLTDVGRHRAVKHIADSPYKLHLIGRILLVLGNDGQTGLQQARFQ